MSPAVKGLIRANATLAIRVALYKRFLDKQQVRLGVCVPTPVYRASAIRVDPWNIQKTEKSLG